MREIYIKEKNLPNEIWLGIDGWEDLYMVSNFSRVKSLKKKYSSRRKDKKMILYERVLKSSNVMWYRQVILCKDGNMTSLRIHRAVAKAFIPNPKNKPHINHKNGIKDDNRIENLEWCTAEENTLHSYRSLSRMPIHGETHNKAKLTLEQVREIRTKYIPYKYSFQMLGDEYGVDQSAISLIINGKNWKHDI